MVRRPMTEKLPTATRVDYGLKDFFLLPHNQLVGGVVTASFCPQKGSQRLFCPGKGAGSFLGLDSCGGGGSGLVASSVQTP